MTLNFPGRVGHAEELVFGEVGLDDATPLDVQLLAPGGAKAVDDGTFNLVFSAAEVDDLRADIGHADDAIHAEFAGFGDGDLGHLSNVAAVTKVKRDALTLTAREFFAPAGFFGDEFDHGFHARGVIGRATFSGAWKGAVITQDFESHGERIAAGGVGELVDEALVDEGEHATAGRAPRAHGNAVLDHAAKAKVIRDKSAGEFIRTESTGEEDSVIAPGGNFARRIDAFLNPEIDPRSQIGYAVNAIQEGGFFGVGLGEGQVKWILPDAHTDFIIAVAAEEYGLVLVALILGLFCTIIVRSLVRLTQERDTFARLAGSGLACILGVQAMINMGVAVRLLPAKGMTLPFISYGGSSIVAIGLGVGMLLALTRRRFPGSVEP